eukprot:CAMPEP_0117466080 /NCGR_PEP_ID=MMETSP0784-20121206/4958_1 /TAXON_ID=39447 /ORGANISM="" /LENGTH=118 /DNA_ID=CAMNT_0005260011 /DNA_START=14 /DNA_END=370 /DNA_ORIENTATION=-
MASTANGLKNKSATSGDSPTGLVTSTEPKSKAHERCCIPRAAIATPSIAPTRNLGSRSAAFTDVAEAGIWRGTSVVRLTNDLAATKQVATTATRAARRRRSQRRGALSAIILRTIGTA